MAKANYVKIAPKISSMLITRPGMLVNIFTKIINVVVLFVYTKKLKVFSLI